MCRHSIGVPLLAVVAVCFGLAAHAPSLAANKSVAACRAFADLSAQQLQTSLAKNCGFKAGWNGTWQQNFDYCRNAEAESTNRIAHNRLVMMNRCENVCPGYAAAAVNDIRIATEGGCIRPGGTQGVTGPLARWSGDYQTHFGWCMSGVSDKVLNRERDVRATEAPRCQICTQYVATTAEFTSEQQQRQCSFDAFHGGDQWSTNGALHFRHCMARPLNEVQRWAAYQSTERHNMLQRCPSLSTQAMCKVAAAHAIAQRRVAVDNRCSFQNLADSRWNASERVHFEGCLLNPETAAPEEAAREALLKACSASARAVGPRPCPPAANSALTWR